MSETILIIDGNSLLNRAFYGVRNLTNSNGFPTNAIYGFTNILKKHLDNINPTHAVCCFDLKGPTFRHKQFPEYKGTRHPMPEELAQQVPYAHELAEAMGYNVVTLPGYEADDLLGTIAIKASQEGIHAYIVSGDRDLLQVITDGITVVNVRNKEDVYYTPSLFLDEKKVTPREYIDVKALMGDSSDNIPGAAGIGEKTAFSLIEEFHSIENLYQSLDSPSIKNGVRTKLIESQNNVFLSKELATICLSAPLEQSVNAFIRHPYDIPKLSEIFTFCEFRTMMEKFREPFSFQAEKKALDLHPIEISFEDLPKCDLYSIFIDPQTNLFSCYCENQLLSVKATEQQIILFLNRSKFVTYNAKSLFRFYGEKVTNNNCVFDCMLAAWLLNPGDNQYPLEPTLDKLLNVTMTDYDPSCYAHFIQSSFVIQNEKITEQKMDFVLQGIEIPLSYVLASMENTGFRLDCSGLHGFVNELTETAQQLEAEIYKKAGHPFNIRSPKQLYTVLFDELSLNVFFPPKAKLSTDAETLNELLPRHPIIADILNYKAVAKLISTYGDNLIELTDAESKIHTTFNQTGTATGRLSSVEPNLQNIPTRKELGKELRKFFTASDEDHILIDADYSQIELRLLASLSQDPTMTEAFKNGFDIHASTASKVFNVPMEEMTPEIRSKAKAINFGIIYGMGPFSLSNDLRIPINEAKAYIETYLSTYPTIKNYLQASKDFAHKNGYVQTAFGRKRPLPNINATNKNIQNFNERIAMNTPLQGTASDIIKLAMIRVFEKLKDENIQAKLILQVHDELILDCRKTDAQKAKQILKETMEQAYISNVPMTVSLSEGSTWYEAK